MIRPAAVAGQFYPASPAQLRQRVDHYLAAAGESRASDQVLAVVAPHAGYPYSGPVAGHAYARVRGKQTDRVILLGRSHHYAFDGAAILTCDACETPLGPLEVDRDFAEALVRGGGEANATPHAPEHSLEVQFPFLQVALGPVKVVPVLFGSDPAPWHESFAHRLAGLIAPGDLIVASTDLSHFLSEDAANALDRHTLDRILSQDFAALADEDAQGTCSMCGTTAVYVAMVCALACRAEDWRLLDYRTSAAASGDFSRVVGYGALSMERAA